MLKKIIFNLLLALLTPTLAFAQNQSAEESSWNSNLPDYCKIGIHDCIPPNVSPWAYVDCASASFSTDSALEDFLISAVNENTDTSQNTRSKRNFHGVQDGETPDIPLISILNHIFQGY